MDPITFDIKLTIGDYIRLYLWAGYIRGYRIAVTIIAILLSTALLALLILSLSLGLSLDAMMAVLFALPAAIMLIFLVSILLTAARAYRSSGLSTGSRCEISSSDIVFENPELRIAITPDRIRRIHFKKKYIYIAMPGTRYYIIPKDCIPEANYETAAGYLEALG